MKPESSFARLLKGWGATAAADTSVALTELQAQFDAFKLSAEADSLELQTALTTAMAAVTELETSRDALAAKLAEVEAAKVQAEVDAAAVKLATRKEKIVAAVGTERADAVFAATESLADSNFNAVLSAMTMAATAESKSKLFTEQGADAEADAAATQPAISKEMQILRDKYAASAA